MIKLLLDNMLYKIITTWKSLLIKHFLFKISYYTCKKILGSEHKKTIYFYSKMTEESINYFKSMKVCTCEELK